MKWGARLVDLAFLKAALGVLWILLDATGEVGNTPSAAFAAASAQAAHTGWFTGTGKFSIGEAAMWARVGGRENAETVLRELYTTDPSTRAKLLMQMKGIGILDSLEWAPIKELHDSLGEGFAEIKSDLQCHFIGGKDKFAP